MEKIILASASPRRKELLSLIFDDFEILPSNAEEIIPEDMDVFDVAEHLAKIKAVDISNKYENCLVIGADTCVITDNKILGKPIDKTDAKNMISMLSGKKHYVVTGCCIIYNGKTETFKEITEVEFLPLSDIEIDEYINTDEPYDKAGGYGIQGKGSLLIKKINGDYFNVVGLPVSKLNMYLKTLKAPKN